MGSSYSRYDTFVTPVAVIELDGRSDRALLCGKRFVNFRIVPKESHDWLVNMLGIRSIAADPSLNYPKRKSSLFIKSLIIYAPNTIESILATRKQLNDNGFIDPLVPSSGTTRMSKQDQDVHTL